MYKYLLYLGMISLSWACKAKQPSQQIPPETEITFPVTIDLGDVEPEAKSLKLSEIATAIEYIPLSNDSIVGTITRFQVADSFIFIKQAGKISSFKTSGRFIRNFPPDGRGPGEDYASCMAINEKDRILYVFGNYTHKIIPFSYEGKWLKKAIPNKFHDNLWDLYAKGKLLFSTTPRLDILKDRSFSLGMNTEDGTVFFKYKNLYVPEDLQKEIIINGYIPTFRVITYQTYQDSLTLFRDQYNDTLYQTVDFKNIFPRYIFHSNKSKVSFIDNMNGFRTGKMDKLKNGYTLEQTLETSSFLFFKVTEYSRTLLGMYEKNKQAVHLFKEMIIQNDMEGGPDFTTYCDLISQWVYKDKLYNLIWPTTLLDHQSKMPPSKAVEQLKQNIKEEDNPILMIVTLKK